MLLLLLLGRRARSQQQKTIEQVAGLLHPIFISLFLSLKKIIIKLENVNEIYYFIICLLPLSLLHTAHLSFCLLFRLFIGI